MKVKDLFNRFVEFMIAIIIALVFLALTADRVHAEGLHETAVDVSAWQLLLIAFGIAILLGYFEEKSKERS